MSKSGFFWNDKESRLSLIVKQRFKNTNSRPIMTEEVSQNCMTLSSRKEEKFIVFIKKTNNFDEIYNFFMNNYWNKIGIFVKLMRSLNEMEELKKFQSSAFDTIARRRLVEDQDTILELTGRIQDLQNEINCMADSKEYQDAESVRSGQSHVTSQPVSFPPHPDPGGMLSRSLGMPSRTEGPPSIWDTHGIPGNVFANPDASSSAPYPQELNQWSSSTEEPLHSSTVEKSERPEQNQDLRCQSGPSAKYSVIFSGRDSSKNYGADQQRLGEKVLHHELLAAQAEHERRILQEELLRQQQDFREVHQQDLMKMKELQKFQNSTFDEFTQKKFIEDQKIIMELSGRLLELQNEVNCMNDTKDFRDAESIRSGNSHVTSPPGLFPRHPPFEGLLKPAFISQRQNEEPPNIRDTSGVSGNVFAHPQTSSSAPYPQELNSFCKKTIEEPIHMSTAEKSGRPERDPDLRCQSRPSARNSVIPSEGGFSKHYGADQQRLQLSDPHFDKFPTPTTFASWKIF